MTRCADILRLTVMWVTGLAVMTVPTIGVATVWAEFEVEDSNELEDACRDHEGRVASRVAAENRSLRGVGRGTDRADASRGFAPLGAPHYGEHLERNGFGGPLTC